MHRILHNPVLSGFYPDPSICRVGEDYYLVTSTFEYFPGLPLFHSRDLVHWRPIGYALDRPSQLPLEGIQASAGLYAPTIRYANGTFYIINTLVDGQIKSGNFIITASDPAGPWSEPFWLENAPGFDPSLFFDDDGRAWYVGTHLLEADRSHYRGHTEVWLQELDLERMCLTGERYGLWEGAVKGAIWAEGPHIYKINGAYYLLAAEGGTAHEHAITVARSQSITGPYQGSPRNPILTHRHLGQDYPIVGTGHADLVETQNGEWWMVLLAMRPYGGYFYNLGRETFLAPVTWEDGWPVVSQGSGRLESSYPAPSLPQQRWPATPACDHFDGPTLALCWQFLRTPYTRFWSLTQRPGYLRLWLRPETLAEPRTPSFVGRRQQHMDFAAWTALDFTPQANDECAGLVLIQNNDFHYRWVVTQDGHPLVRLIRRVQGQDEVLAECPITAGRVYLKVEAHGQAYDFYVASQSGAYDLVAAGVDGRILSTPVAGGFVGAMIGLYASSNGQASTNFADFDWFEYQGLDAN